MSRKLEEFQEIDEMFQRRQRLGLLVQEVRKYFKQAEEAGRRLKQSLDQSPDMSKEDKRQLRRWVDAIILSARGARLTALSLWEEL